MDGGEGGLMQKISQIIFVRNTLERIGNALMLIGFVTIFSFLVLAVLSVLGAAGGWEYVWFLPRAGFIYFIISAVTLLAFGLVLRFAPRLIKK